MRYILIGKRCTYLDVVKEKISKSILDKDVEILYLNKPTGFSNEKDKIIYIKTPIQYSWEYWVGEDIKNDEKLKSFTDEIMDFRELDEEKCHLILNCEKANSFSVFSAVEKIKEFINKCERECENQ